MTIKSVVDEMLKNNEKPTPKAGYFQDVEDAYESISQLQQQGFTLLEIHKRLQQAGLTIHVTTLRKHVKTLRTGHKKQPRSPKQKSHKTPQGTGQQTPQPTDNGTAQPKADQSTSGISDYGDYAQGQNNESPSGIADYGTFAQGSVQIPKPVYEAELVTDN